jgi:hypothetical protein
MGEGEEKGEIQEKKEIKKRWQGSTPKKWGGKREGKDDEKEGRKEGSIRKEGRE